jgi:hypothetical protein
MVCQGALRAPSVARPCVTASPPSPPPRHNNPFTLCATCDHRLTCAAAAPAAAASTSRRSSASLADAAASCCCRPSACPRGGGCQCACVRWLPTPHTERPDVHAARQPTRSNASTTPHTHGTP